MIAGVRAKFLREHGKMTRQPSKPPFLSDVLSVILPTPDQTALLRACLWTGEAGREAWTRWQNSVTNLKQAFKENGLTRELLPLLYRTLEQNQAEVDKSFLPYFRIAYVHEELRSRAYCRIFKETVLILAASGIPFLVVGAASLAERVYDNGTLRHCHDVDFLLKKEDLSSCQRFVGRRFFSSQRKSKFGRGWLRAQTRFWSSCALAPSFIPTSSSQSTDR